AHVITTQQAKAICYDTFPKMAPERWRYFLIQGAIARSLTWWPPGPWPLHKEPAHQVIGISTSEVDRAIFFEVTALLPKPRYTKHILLHDVNHLPVVLKQWESIVSHKGDMDMVMKKKSD